MTGPALRLRLPYVPHPYPDEILGSWLTRVATFMGRGAWRSLLEAVGFGRRIQSSYFDIVDYDPRLGELLSLLGFDYETALLKLTTYPYWITFSASSSGKPLKGTVNVPELAGRLSPTSIRLLGSKRTIGEKAETRYCPTCVSEDYEEFGQPYWHRAHQLPNVFFCHKHHCKLRSVCPYCGTGALRGAKQMLPLPAMICQCGKRLDKPSRSRASSRSELKLVDISANTLSQALPTWDQRHVLRSLQSSLSDHRKSLGRYKAVLIDTFALAENTEWGLSSMPLGTEGDRIRFRSTLGLARAPECCGLLVALNIDLDSAIKNFAEHAEQNKVFVPMAPPGPRIVLDDIETARKTVIRAHEKYPNRPISACKLHYWNLRLNDSDWLFDRFPNMIRTFIPSIDSDREELRSLLEGLQLGLLTAAKIKKGAAGQRAQIRDFAWLEEQRSRVRDDSTATTERLKKSVLQVRIAALENALSKILESEKRPARITSLKLASSCGLSQSQAGDAIRAHAPLRQLIQQANDDKERRQLIWAGRQLHLDGGRLSKKQIAKKAGLPTAFVSDEVHAEILRLHSYGEVSYS